MMLIEPHAGFVVLLFRKPPNSFLIVPVTKFRKFLMHGVIYPKVPLHSTLEHMAEPFGLI